MLECNSKNIEVEEMVIKNDNTKKEKLQKNYNNFSINHIIIFNYHYDN